MQTLQDANSKLEEKCLRKEPSLASSAVSKVSRHISVRSKTRHVCPPQVGLTGEERSLQEAEEKIAGLLQVKEKLVNVEVISCKYFLLN